MAIQSFSVGQVLTAAQVNALQANDYNQTVSNKTNSYTLVAADKGTRITMSSTSATTITVNDSLFSAGDTLFIQNLNTGVSTITAGTATVTTASSLALAQWEGGTLYFTSASAAIFFKSDGAAPAAGGGMTLISEQVFSGSTGFAFSSIPSTYKQLLLIWDGIYHTAGSTVFDVRLNNVSSAGTYPFQLKAISGTTITNLAFATEPTSLLSESGTYSLFGYVATTATYLGSSKGYLLIDNYASTTKKKFMTGQWMNNDGAYKSAPDYKGQFNSTSAITSIDIVRITGAGGMSNLADTSVRLYGVN